MGCAISIIFPKVTWGKTFGLTTNSSSVRRISSFAKAIKSLQRNKHGGESLLTASTETFLVQHKLIGLTGLHGLTGKQNHEIISGISNQWESWILAHMKVLTLPWHFPVMTNKQDLCSNGLNYYLTLKKDINTWTRRKQYLNSISPTIHCQQLRLSTDGDSIVA